MTRIERKCAKLRQEAPKLLNYPFALCFHGAQIVAISSKDGELLAVAVKMEVTLKYFAWVRERIGIAEEKAILPGSIATVSDVIRWLKQRGEGYAAAFAREDLIRAAVDRAHAKHTESVQGAREIAFFPPVTGG